MQPLNLNFGCATTDNGYFIHRYRILPVLPARFFQKVSFDAVTGCWFWTGTVRRNHRYPKFAYGSFWNHRTKRVEGAHRFAYNFAYGPISDGLEIDHTCRNSLCVNPRHLEPVTHAENIRRRGPTRFAGDGKTWNGGAWPRLRREGQQ